MSPLRLVLLVSSFLGANVALVRLADRLPPLAGIGALTALLALDLGLMLAALAWLRQLLAPPQPRRGEAELLEQLALAHPYVVDEPPAVPQASGVLAADVAAWSGLTLEELAALLACEPSQLTLWIAGLEQPQGEPLERLQALQRICGALVGGLGPDGVARWLDVGRPSRRSLFEVGGLDAVVAEAERYLDSVAD